jgi:hypothetical protein
VTPDGDRLEFRLATTKRAVTVLASYRVSNGSEF